MFNKRISDLECGYTECAQYFKCHYARWIWGARPWDTWATLTFETPHDSEQEGVYRGRSTVGIAYVRGRMEEWVSALNYRSIAHAVVLERGAHTGRLHYHALLHRGTASVPTWRAGFSKCEPVQSQKSAYYLSKYVTKGDLDLICGWNDVDWRDIMSPKEVT